jgi:hypothetical protein
MKISSYLFFERATRLLLLALLQSCQAGVIRGHKPSRNGALTACGRAPAAVATGRVRRIRVTAVLLLRLHGLLLLRVLMPHLLRDTQVLLLLLVLLRLLHLRRGGCCSAAHGRAENRGGHHVPTVRRAAERLPHALRRAGRRRLRVVALALALTLLKRLRALLLLLLLLLLRPLLLALLLELELAQLLLQRRDLSLLRRRLLKLLLAIVRRANSARPACRPLRLLLLVLLL